MRNKLAPSLAGNVEREVATGHDPWASPVLLMADWWPLLCTSGWRSRFEEDLVETFRGMDTPSCDITVSGEGWHVAAGGGPGTMPELA